MEDKVPGVGLLSRFTVIVVLAVMMCAASFADKLQSYADEPAVTVAASDSDAEPVRRAFMDARIARHHLLEPDPQRPRYLRTGPGVGYRLIADEEERG